ncbi:hypothetical protein D3C87_2043650 [compost metagenome]
MSPAIAPIGFVFVMADSTTADATIVTGFNTTLQVGAAALPAARKLCIVGSVRMPYPGANLADTGGLFLLTPIAASR